MRCKDCEYVKCYAVNKKMYYCDNRNRTNLMGKLGEDNLPETSPECSIFLMKIKIWQRFH